MKKRNIFLLFVALATSISFAKAKSTFPEKEIGSLKKMVLNGQIVNPACKTKISKIFEKLMPPKSSGQFSIKLNTNNTLIVDADNKIVSLCGVVNGQEYNFNKRRGHPLNAHYEMVDKKKYRLLQNEIDALNAIKIYDKKSFLKNKNKVLRILKSALKKYKSANPLRGSMEIAKLNNGGNMRLNVDKKEQAVYLNGSGKENESYHISIKTTRRKICIFAAYYTTKGVCVSRASFRKNFFGRRKLKKLYNK